MKKETQIIINRIMEAIKTTIVVENKIGLKYCEKKVANIISELIEKNKPLK